ncbi:putative Sugar transferase-a glycosyl transferase [Planktothrix serta PCC 8927]|uniref:Sugar transferase-a glycosyl transferase n=1 Tax=Planktothrix serta PCC 8927 TaxID=671068 RepID=A0A7Z9BRF8_9CYAN|nr:glycosyltransferase [Planktothrix serta]VXD19177.1 putative Sugar transferase-a glycosyl transferase [Planktothrix serta PCC 8927]
MAENESLVSVIIRVYNGDRYLAEAIESVLAQTYRPIEVIVVDDGSTDKTAEIAAQFKDCIRYIYQQNSGPAAARNHGIKIANGDVIAFLDVDDLWSDDKLKLEANYLADNPSVEIVQGLIQNLKISHLTNDNIEIFEKEYHPYNYINLGSGLYRKLVFDKIGLFDESLRYAEDVDWFIRAWENSISKVVLKQVTLFYRKHRENMTVGKTLTELGFVRIFKKHLDRCRKKGTSPRSVLPGMPTINEYLGAPPNTPKIS